MPGLTGASQQAMKLISGYLNGENNPAPGSPISNSSFSGGLVANYAGMLGAIEYLSEDDALKMSLTTTGTLYGGEYQMVRLASGSGAVVPGQLAFWDPSVAVDLYQVTVVEATAVNVSLKAGVFLNVITPGNYGFIQISGRANMKAKASLTIAAAVGQAMYASGAGAGADNATVDNSGGAGAATLTNITTLAARYVGVAEQLPVAGALRLVNMQNFVRHQ